MAADAMAQDDAVSVRVWGPHIGGLDVFCFNQTFCMDFTSGLGL